MLINPRIVLSAVNNIERGAGHTTRAVKAALAADSTMVVGRTEIAVALMKCNPGLRAISIADLAKPGIERGPLLFDPDAIQAIYGCPNKQKWADPKWTRGDVA